MIITVFFLSFSCGPNERLVDPGTATPSSPIPYPFPWDPDPEPPQEDPPITNPSPPQDPQTCPEGYQPILRGKGNSGQAWKMDWVELSTAIPTKKFCMIVQEPLVPSDAVIQRIDFSWAGMTQLHCGWTHVSVRTAFKDDPPREAKGVHGSITYRLNQMEPGFANFSKCETCVERGIYLIEVKGGTPPIAEQPLCNQFELSWSWQ